MSGTFELRGDQDAFSFPVVAGTSYTVHLTSGQPLYLMLESPGALDEGFSGETDRPFTAQQTGTAYFLLSTYSSLTPFPTSYTISISSP